LSDFSLSVQAAFFLQQAFFSPEQAAFASAGAVVVAVAVAGASVSVFVMPAQALASPDFILQQDFFVSQDFLSFLSLSSSLTMME
jgi:hypothetical protein